MGGARPVDIKRIERPTLIDWVTRDGANFALTLNPNRELSPQNLCRLFGRLMKRMDEKIIPSRRMGNVASEDRLWAIGFVEHPDSNIHLHVALRLKLHQLSAAPAGEEGWRDFINKAWSVVTKGSGTMKFERTTTAAGWTKYITKENTKHELDYIMAADFHPDSALGRRGYESIEIQAE